MEVDDILEKYGLNPETATEYIDSITRLNQTDTAQEIGVSRDTVNRYKNAFAQMNKQERLQLIAGLSFQELLAQTSEE